MRETFNHKLLTSFYLWFDHYLLTTGEAFSNQNTIFYPSIDNSLPGYSIFASPYHQFVYDSSVPNANVLSGVAPVNSDNVIGRGVSGLMFDYQNGRVFADLAVTGELYDYITGSYSGNTPAYIENGCNSYYIFTGGQLVQTTGIPNGFYYFMNTSSRNLTPTVVGFSGNYAKKEFNTYITSETNQKLVLEQVYSNNPNLGVAATGLAPYIYAAPCAIISLSNGDNEGFALGGQDTTKMTARALVVTKDLWQQDGIQSIFRDTNNLPFPIIPANDSPLNFYGDLKTGYYNYNELINKYGDPSTMPWIDAVYTSKITENANKNNTYFLSYLEFDINCVRYPRQNK